MLIYLEPGARFLFNGTGDIRLSGRRSGPHAGFVLMQAYDAEAPIKSATFNMSNRSYLDGTIYLPRHRLTVNGNSHFNHNAAYTKIIADEFLLNGTGSFVMGSDYTGRTPLPEGLQQVQGVRRVVRLIE